MPSWFQQIDDAADGERLVAVARDYFASWTPSELALLPPQCRPGRMKDARDLADLHGALVDAYRDSGIQGDALAALQRITSFVVRASMRAAQLAAAADQSAEPPTGPFRSEASREG